jgi:hypothetical protein
VINLKSHNNYLLQDCIKANQTRSVHVNLIKLGTFREQLYDETVYTPLTDSEPPRQTAVLLRTLRNLNLNATSAPKAHGHFYDDDDATLLRAVPAAAAAADAAAAAGNGPIQGQAKNSRTRRRPAASFAKSTDARFADRHPTAGTIHFG